MDNYKFTKGKWQIAGSENTFVYALNEKGTNAFSLNINNDGKTPLEEQQANALLISKSPLLLKAIKDSINELREVGLNDMANYHEKLYNECVNL